MIKIKVESPVTGTVWKILMNVGDVVTEDNEIMILESMKMEIPVSPSVSGRIVEILVKENDSLEEDDVVAIIETD